MVKMSYVENVPPARGSRHDWITVLSELVNSGHQAIRLECESVREAHITRASIYASTKRKGFDVAVALRGNDVYVINKNAPKK